MVTAGEIPDPHALEIVCRIWRGGHLLYEGLVNTGQMKRRHDELARWLCQDDLIAPGTVRSAGTGLRVPDEHSLRDGDVVEVTPPGFGTLRNPVRRPGPTAQRGR